MNNAYEKMYKKVKGFSDYFLQQVWEALEKSNADPKELWDRQNGITMGEWTEAVYSEMSKRQKDRN